MTSEAIAAGHECICIYRSQIPEELINNKKITWIKGCLNSDWSKQFIDVDVVLHLAAIGVSPQKVSWEEAMKVNVLDSLKFIENAVIAGVKNVIACGSCFEYGVTGEHYEFIPVNAPLKPNNPYGASKAAATYALCALARQKKFSLIILRPFHIYGEGQGDENLWPSLKRAALAGKDFKITKGQQIRDYVSVEFVAKKFIDKVKKIDGEKKIVIENIGSGNPVDLATFCSHWWKKFNASGKLWIGALAYRDDEVMRFVPEI